MGKSGGTLDYVAAWFIKAGEYIQTGKGRIGFVATNSITQGQQVAQLWPILFDRFQLEIAFAHRSFKWASDAKGKAHVHVVILGLDHNACVPSSKRLFSYLNFKGEPMESEHSLLSPYLFDASNLKNPMIAVREESCPINGLHQMIIGSKPIDGGHYIFDERARNEFLKMEPGATPFMRPYVGAREFLHGKMRWILALHDAPPNVLAMLPHIRKRIAAVRTYREKSKSKPTQKLAETPTLYHVNTIPDTQFLLIPRVSSERREYIPIGWLHPPAIPSDGILVLQNATLIDFGLLTSSMHMAWMRVVTGRLESRYLYSAGVVYNAFPLPSQSCELDSLVSFAQAILETRDDYKDSTLAQLYDPDLMPPDLRSAHQKLDLAVDKLYRREGFDSEQDRVQHLFLLYEEMKWPMNRHSKA